MRSYSALYKHKQITMTIVLKILPTGVQPDQALYVFVRNDEVDGLWQLSSWEKMEAMSEQLYFYALCF